MRQILLSVIFVQVVIESIKLNEIILERVRKEKRA